MGGINRSTHQSVFLISSVPPEAFTLRAHSTALADGRQSLRPPRVFAALDLQSGEAAPDYVKLLAPLVATPSLATGSSSPKDVVSTPLESLPPTRLSAYTRHRSIAASFAALPDCDGSQAKLSANL